MVRHIKDVLNEDVRLCSLCSIVTGSIYTFLISRAASWLLTPLSNLLLCPRKARIL